MIIFKCFNSYFLSLISKKVLKKTVVNLESELYSEEIVNIQSYFNTAHSNRHSQAFIKSLFKIIEIIWENNSKAPITILDSGCGSGVFSRLLLNKYSSNVIGKIYGSDIEKWMDKELAGNERFYFVYPKDLVRKEFSNFFDFVFSADVIEHVEDDLNYVKEIAHEVSRKGVFLVFTPNTDRLNKFVMHKVFRYSYTYPKVVSVDSINGTKMEHVHLREYSYNELKAILASHFSNILDIPLFVGFKLPRVGFVGSYNHRLNTSLFRYMDHLLFICSKSSLVNEIIKNSFIKY